MRCVRVAVLLLVWMVLAIGAVAHADMEEQGWSHLKQYWGGESVDVHTCGQPSGSCEGTISLLPQYGGEVMLAVRPEMWIERRDRRVQLKDLRVGDEIHCPRAALPPRPADRLDRDRHNRLRL